MKEREKGKKKSGGYERKVWRQFNRKVAKREREREKVGTWEREGEL
jgi:hypothetical protein